MVQETLYLAYRDADRLRDPERREQWLAGIARHLCSHWLRGRQRERTHLASLPAQAGEGPLDDDRASADPVAEFDLERAELVALRDRAMARLPVETRRVLLERYVAESPRAAIALQLGLSEGAVAMRLERGKLALRQLLSTEMRAPLLLQQVLQLVQAVPQLAGYMVALASLSPLLVLLVLGTKIPTAAAWGSSGQYGWMLLRQQTRQRRLADYYASTLTERAFAQEVRLYGLAGYLLDCWATLFQQTRDERRRRLLWLSLRLRATGAASTAAIYAGLWWVIAAGLLRGAGAGAVALLFQSLNGLIHGVFQTFSTVQALGEQAGYASALRAFLGEMRR